MARRQKRRLQPALVLPRALAVALEEAAEEVKGARKTPPAGYPSDHSQYADPKHLKYPIDRKHIKAALSYFNKKGQGAAGGYSSGQWAAIGRRIAGAARRLLGAAYRFSGGKVVKAGATEGDLLLDGVVIHADDLPLDLAWEDAPFAPFDEDDDEFYPDDADVLVAGGPVTEEAFDLVPLVASVSVEETLVNGEACFQWESMVVPGDAISRNTVPGKKGPTYYSGRRMQQYFTENTRLLEELNASGQKVTVYPRHAAAVLEAMLPIGWVDRYELRPSVKRPGVQDLWYVGTGLLGHEGSDVRGKMRAGLVQFSSLRSFPEPRFKTQPVKVNGQVVEEAISLPIAGIDLVATLPGLPVTPIRVLEEDAVIETADAESGEVANDDPAAAGASEEKPTMKKYGCPHCKADVTSLVTDAVAEVNPDAGKSAAEEAQSAALLTERDAKILALETELTQVREAAKTASTAGAAASTTTAGASEEEARRVAQLRELELRLVAVEEENKLLAGVKQQFAEQQLRASIEAEFEKRVTEGDNQPLLAYILGKHEDEVEKALGALESVDKVGELYWMLRGKYVAEFMQSANRLPAGFGHVHVLRGAAAAGAGEPRHAGATAGAANEEAEEEAGDEDGLNPLQRQVLGGLSTGRRAAASAAKK